MDIVLLRRHPCRSEPLRIQFLNMILLKMDISSPSGTFHKSYQESARYVTLTRTADCKSSKQRPTSCFSRSFCGVQWHRS
ncbi:hypothetical protein DPMN_098908 [Dreissena polymorpha]|uniref:Uncharacterized protein n=1 Tax=Dreissena polymorpha TaxID=45954 RepID=A0A9D4R759_DREPO|nr:hypothetical protein DPMN_098908 [Dreissena polymorpha]